MVFPLSDADAATMELDDYGPLAPPVGTPLDGPMATSGKVFWRAANGVVFTGIWECGAGRMRADFGNDGELVHVVKGTLRAVADEDGAEVVVRPGESATFPPFWSGVWHLEEPMRQVFCVFDFSSLAAVE